MANIQQKHHRQTTDDRRVSRRAFLHSAVATVGTLSVIPKYPLVSSTIAQLQMCLQKCGRLRCAFLTSGGVSSTIVEKVHVEGLALLLFLMKLPMSSRSYSTGDLARIDGTLCFHTLITVITGDSGEWIEVTTSTAPSAVPSLTLRGSKGIVQSKNNVLFYYPKTEDFTNAWPIAPYCFIEKEFQRMELYPIRSMAHTIITTARERIIEHSHQTCSWASGADLW